MVTHDQALLNSFADVVDIDAIRAVVDAEKVA